MSDNFNYEIKRESDILIFKLNEKRFDAQIAGLVKGEFTIILHADEIDKLILDLSSVEYCDSSGLSAILLAYRIIQSNEGVIRIAAPTKSVRTLIEISQLDRILPILPTVDEAIADIQKG